MGYFIHIGNVDETNGSLISKSRLTLTNCQSAQITDNNWNQSVMNCIIKVSSFLQGNIKINFLGVACGCCCPSGNSKWALFTIYPTCRPDKISKSLQGQLLIAY